MMQDAVANLLRLTGKITDNLDPSIIEEIVVLLDQVKLPISEEDARALLSLLPENGDTGHGVNWTILHTIETSHKWPIWSALNDPQNEWMEILEIRLNNGGLTRQ